MTMVGRTTSQPTGPEGCRWLVEDFVASTPGVADALIVASDGLLLISCRMPEDAADPLAAATSGLISLAHNIARQVGQSNCDQIMLKFPQGHLLFMRIGALAGLAVLVTDGAHLGVVANQMAKLVGSVGHVLTPQMRDDLRARALGQAY